jgi:hypothetical protein
MLVTDTLDENAGEGASNLCMLSRHEVRFGSAPLGSSTQVLEFTARLD